jgi:hypothetical protein
MNTLGVVILEVAPQHAWECVQLLAEANKQAKGD